MHDIFPTDDESLRRRVAELEGQLRELRLPVPPPHLRLRVGGWEDVDHFLGVGRKVRWDIGRMLRMAGRDLESFRRILDFGCGCGRTLRFLPAGLELTGCDIDPESIAWCRENLTNVGRFTLSEPDPPLPFDDGSFDLVYAISVFTHLPEDMQYEWLAELRRVLAPGGFLLASTHGPDLMPEGDPRREELVEEGFVYMKGPGTAGLPEFYQTTFHMPAYVEARWQEGFELVANLQRGINNHQDAFVLRRTG